MIRVDSNAICSDRMIPILAALLGLGLYLLHVNSVMKTVPPEAKEASPRRWTVDEIKDAYKKAIENPVDVNKSIPPKQTRRYVVVGGSGTFCMTYSKPPKQAKKKIQTIQKIKSFSKSFDDLV